ncbi:SRPBCC family protein [Streptomyces sp. SCSIO 30461]|uniref:SRPBCC family protein n=1 Tax=Streptomyces sp. SCSIO 30461 TaxID=3118085 RepID=UPI0030CC2F28
MALFRVVRTTSLPPAETWRRLTEWPAHAAHVPLTRVAVLTPGPPGTGTRFVARTGLGRWTFDDTMEIVRWQPPAPELSGRCRLEKRGRTVMGWAEIEVLTTPEGSRVVWEEELRLRGVPRALDPAVAGTARRLFGRVVDGLLTARQ